MLSVVVDRRCRPFLGAEALAAGTLNRHQLRTKFTLLYPGVYLAKNLTPTLQVRTEAAWLWSRRRAVVAGQAAAAELGAKWVDANAVVDLVCRNARAPIGVLTRDDMLYESEVRRLQGMPFLVTTAARTGFDLGRRGPIGIAVARLDALFRATGITAADVERVAGMHTGVRGLRQLETTLQLVDAGAESPKETWVRLLLAKHGFPRVQTQIEVRDHGGKFVARLDMGWPHLKIAVEYDGEQHRTNRAQYVRDIRRLESLERQGWIVIRVLKEDPPAAILRRIRAAIASRNGS